MQAETRRLSLNGLNHLVRDSGPPEAPAFLLLHGFPDHGGIWTPLTPFLLEAGFRVIAPDLRGFGETDMAPSVADYDIATGAVPDMIALMDALEIKAAHIVGHDFGAPVAWNLAANHPDRTHTLSALSVGHPRAFLNAGAEQKIRSLYIVLHQFSGLCEAIYRFNDFAFARSHWRGAPDIEAVVQRLARPGRLTAGLNWYRANASLKRMISPPPPGAFGEEIVRRPTLGVWGGRDPYLGEAQMRSSAAFVDAPWTFETLPGAGHWVQADAPAALAALLIRHAEQG